MIQRIEEVAALERLAARLCPDCGGKLLRGQRGAASRNYTCGSCAAKFNFHGVCNGILLAVDRMGHDQIQSAYHNPIYPVRQCDFCEESYTGPAVYCSLGCAIEDAI